jgi:exosortase/archaeosortase family protein
MYVKSDKVGNKVGWALRLSILIGSVSYLVVGYPGYYPLPEATASVTSFFLNLMGINAVALGRYIAVSFPSMDCTYMLSSECSGIIIYIMFLIGIAVVPYFRTWHRLVALGFLPLLFLGNASRILMSILVGYQFSVDASEFFHATVGQVLIFFWILVCFIAWLKLTKNFPIEKKKEVTKECIED